MGGIKTHEGQKNNVASVKISGSSENVQEKTVFI